MCHIGGFSQYSGIISYTWVIINLNLMKSPARQVDFALLLDWAYKYLGINWYRRTIGNSTEKVTLESEKQQNTVELIKNRTTKLNILNFIPLAASVKYSLINNNNGTLTVYYFEYKLNK